MFSYLMRKIIEKGINKGNIKNKNIILPYYEDNVLNGTTKLGVGLFPDRLLYKGEITELQKVIDEVINEFAGNICKDLKNNQSKNKSTVCNESNNCIVKDKKGNEKECNLTNFFKTYLHIIPLEADYEKDENIIFKLNALLDTAELKQKALLDLGECEKCLIDFLEKYEPKYNFLHIDEFTDKKGHFRKFKSTAEIATAEFQDEKFYETASKELKRDLIFKDENGNIVDQQKIFYDEIKKAADKLFYNFHKYMIIVQADGDNIGEFIKQIYCEKNISRKAYVEQFSENLWKFSREAVDLINDYKGSPVYAGGDDLLFFAPVAHTKLIGEGEIQKAVIDYTLFKLIDKIDKRFDRWFTEFNENGVDFKTLIEKLDKKPTMSYGVSIAYYKFPLNEAFEQAIEELFYKAKKTCKKNAVSFSVLKHSGQFFGTIFNKSSKSYETFTKMLSEDVKDGEFIHSVAQKLGDQEAVLYAIGMECEEEKRNLMFDNFFDNNFDESVHRRKKADGTTELIPFLQSVKQLLKDVYTENPIWKSDEEKDRKLSNKKNLEKLYAAQRFMEFINNKIDR